MKSSIFQELKIYEKNINDLFLLQAYLQLINMHKFAD